MKTLISKGEYARRHQRSPAAVTKWIKLGRISAEALVGEGNGAKIWLERADADLSARLDPSQQVNQAAPILPSAGAGGAAMMTEPSVTPTTTLRSPVLNERELDLARRAKADATKAEYDAEAARRKLATDEGKWVDAGEAARTWGRELARLMADTETFLFTVMARKLAERHGLEVRSLAVEIRDLFHEHRAVVSEDARERLGALDGEIAEAAE